LVSEWLDESGTSEKMRQMSSRGWWMVAMMVWLLLTARSDRNLVTLRAAKLSSPVVGSSKKTTEGEATIPMAMLSRLLCPPDKPLTLIPPGRSPPT